jgi:hypothetical protein
MQSCGCILCPRWLLHDPAVVRIKKTLMIRHGSSSHPDAHSKKNSPHVTVHSSHSPRHPAPPPSRAIPRGASTGHRPPPAPSSRTRPARAHWQPPVPAPGPFLPALARPELAGGLRPLLACQLLPLRPPTTATGHCAAKLADGLSPPPLLLASRRGREGAALHLPIPRSVLC